jgi:nucleoside-diphosphate-sugar epimerase
MSQIVKDAPQVIFHLAAQAYVPYSFDHPVEVMKINLQGTLHILEAARQIKSIEHVVCTSSCEIYGTPLTARIREDHALNPMSPYAASKAAADRYASSYFSTYGLPITIARPFNAYGPRQTGNVVRRFIHFALKNEPITLHGDGSQSRDFTYVDDMVKAYLAIGARNKALGKAINLGSGREISMIQLARKIVRLCGSRSEIIHIPKRLADVPHFKADSSLAAKILGWEAETQLEEGLKKTLEWTGENLQAG